MSIERHDDQTLADDDRLLRRIRREQIISDDREAGRYRPMSMAFREGADGEVSVYVRSLTTVEAVLEGHAEFSLAEITVGLARSVGCRVAKTPEDPNPAHRVIIHPSKSGMRKAAKIFADQALWVKLIPPVAPNP
ncbi:MAG: hypothetical protein ACLQIB_24235 [Isosphaeraceae bacterium]